MFFLSFCPPPPLPLPSFVHTVPQCQVSSTTAEMAKPTPFPHTRTAPEGEPNRSTPWVAASPLSVPHLSTDPCPASGATTRIRLSLPSSSSLHNLCVGKGEGNQITMLRRQWLPCQGHSLNQCDDEVLGHSEAGPGLTENPDGREVGSKMLQGIKKAIAYRNTGHCLQLICSYLVFSPSATMGRWSVIFSLV